MRYVWHGLWFMPAMLAAAVAWGVSAAANIRFGLSLGTDDAFSLFFFQISTAQVYSSASIAFDILKTCTPFALVAAWQAGMRRASLALVIALGVSVIWSLSSALGFAAISNSAATDLRGKDVLTWEKLTDEISRLEERRKWIPEARPLAAVEADRIGMEQHYLFGQTEQCRNATLTDSIQHCRTWRALKVEEANAAEIVKLDESLAAKRNELRDTPKVSSESPRDEMLAYATGYEKRTISTGYGVFFALMIEAVATFGFWSFCQGYGAATRQQARVIPIEIKPVEQAEKISEEPLEISIKETEPNAPQILESVRPEKVHRLQLAVVPRKLIGNIEIDKVTLMWIKSRMDRVDVDRNGGAAHVLHADYIAFCKSLPEPIEGVNVSQLGKSVCRLKIAMKRTSEAALWGLRLKAEAAKAA
jgi:hypothetical protein